MFAAFFSVVAAACSISSLLTIRRMKREQDAAMSALKPLIEGVSRSKVLLQTSGILKSD